MQAQQFVELEFEPAPPAPASLVESLRGVGYSMPTAVADIIDNSIAAGAGNVWLDFRWGEGDSTATVLDDGHGMDAPGLLEAMRLGGRGPSGAREGRDLGRFGLGLKTASFSQCRCLTVASRRESTEAVVRRWDLEHIASARDWHLLKGAAPGSAHLLEPLARVRNGTLILWEQLDRLAPAGSGDELSERVFLEAIERLEEHLAMVFHRYLEGPAPTLRIYINGREEQHRVKPWDPFLSDHPQRSAGL